MHFYCDCARRSPSFTVGSSAVALCSPPPVALCANEGVLPILCVDGTAMVDAGTCSTLYKGLSATLRNDGLKRTSIAGDLEYQAGAVFSRAVSLLVKEGF